MRHVLSRWLLLLGVALASAAVLAWLPAESAGAFPQGKKGKKGEIRGEFVTMQGTVQQFTTAPRGEVDGLILNDGTWVHWPPHLEDQFSGIAVKGDKVRVHGQMVTGKKGDTKLEVSTITNLRTGKSRQNADLPAPTTALERPGSVEKRLQALEDRMEQLLQEVRRIRGKK